MPVICPTCQIFSKNGFAGNAMQGYPRLEIRSRKSAGNSQQSTALMVGRNSLDAYRHDKVRRKALREFDDPPIANHELS